MLESSKEGSSCLSRASPCYSGATDRQRMAPSKAEVCSRILEGEKRERTALRLRCERFSQAQLCSSAVVVGEEATEMRDSQECILSGGVYLRHRLEKPAFQNMPARLFPIQILRIKWLRGHTFRRAAFRRSGVQETAPFRKDALSCT